MKRPSGLLKSGSKKKYQDSWLCILALLKESKSCKMSSSQKERETARLGGLGKIRCWLSFKSHIDLDGSHLSLTPSPLLTLVGNQGKIPVYMITREV